MMLMLVAEQSLASGDEGQQTVTAQKKGSSEQIEVYNLIVLSPEPSLTLQGWPARPWPLWRGVDFFFAAGRLVGA